MQQFNIYNQSGGVLIISSLDNTTLNATQEKDLFHDDYGGFSEADMIGNEEIQTLLDTNKITITDLSSECHLYSVLDSGHELRTTIVDLNVFNNDITLYNHVGIQSAKTIIIDCSANISIDGLNFGYNGEIKLLMNDSPNRYIDLIHNETLQQSSDRFYVPEATAKFRILKKSQIYLIYMDNRWRPILERQSGTI